ncbi:hypothetical protein [Chengkuizengella axinellae]|uniref:N-acetyltransferase n=1 Tax=Chengkuizengella axinellae TaxID=3064388 RepID=A0ABT9J1Z2_9BACL|nr:hypothetical protein [Chengkuizengella sp. 2205SS18-9]MDP5275447.1 hypothetical protein [Chengkuizengella sp. 2205SS18-9]
MKVEIKSVITEEIKSIQSWINLSQLENQTLPLAYGSTEKFPFQEVTSKFKRSTNTENSLTDLFGDNQDHLHPYMITVDSIIAGFAVIESSPYKCGENDYILHGLYLSPLFHANMIIERAAVQLFDCFHGNWEFHTTNLKLSDMQSWRKAIANYTEGEFQEYIQLTPNGKHQVYKFSNDSYHHYMKSMLEFYGH